MIQYKVIKEYPTYYLCEHPKGWKECFTKERYKPINGYITVKKEKKSLFD